MSDSDIYMQIFMVIVGIIVAICTAPLIAIWAVFAAILFILSFGRIGRKWWNEKAHQIKESMSSNFWFVLFVVVICTDILLVCGIWIRYRMGESIRVGESEPITWASVGTLVLQKDLLKNFWRWNYGSEEISVYQMCPTWFGHDAIAKVNDQVQASTDGKFITNLWKYDLKDHTGANVYTIEASEGEAILNYLHLSLSVAIKNAEEVVAYVEGSAFIVDDFTMKAADGTPILRFHRNKMKIEAWKWEITPLDARAETIFPPVYAAVFAGHHAFTDKTVFNAKDSTDTCNRLIAYAVISCIVCAAIGAPSLLYLLYLLVRDITGRKLVTSTPTLKSPLCCVVVEK